MIINTIDDNSAGDIREELQELLRDKKFSSIDDAQEYVKQHTAKRDAAPLGEFQGLSPYQMHRLLHFPFESPDVIRFDFNNAGAKPEDAPLTYIVKLIAEATGEKGLKPTATGNLPLALCRDIAKKVLSPELHEWLAKYSQFRSENAIPYLTEVRMVAKLAGFIKKSNGKFVLGATLRKLIAADAWPQIYEKMFVTFIREFNWAYPKSLLEVPFFQQSFAFTLYLFNKFGNSPRPLEFYEDCFLTAFPMLTDGIADTEYVSASSRLKMVYGAQAIHLFGEVAGIVSCRRENMVTTVTAAPLLQRLVSFHNPAAG